MSPRNTRDNIVRAAMELFYTRGYEATSVAEILEKSGAGSGSLYYFFKDKADLALAVADLYHDMLFEVLFKPVYTTVEDPLERIFAVLNNYRRSLVESKFVYGCPIGNLALEVNESLPEVTARLADNFRGWAEEMEKLLKLAADRFPPDTDFKSLSVFILTTMEGGVMLARTCKDIAPFDAAIEQLSNYIVFMQAV